MSWIIAKVNNTTGVSESVSDGSYSIPNGITTVFYDADFFTDENFKDIYVLIESGDLVMIDIYGVTIDPKDAEQSFNDILDFINTYPKVLYNGLSYAFNGTISRYVISKCNQYIIDNNGDADNFESVLGVYESMLMGLKVVSIDYWTNKISDTFYTTSFKDEIIDLINIGYR